MTPPLRITAALVLAAALLVSPGCDDASPSATAPTPTPRTAAPPTGAGSDGGQVPLYCGDEAIPEALIDLIGTSEYAYCGFGGGLYRGSNTPPQSHRLDGERQIDLIQPLNAAGQPDSNGAIVLLAIGMSNATQEWCHPSSPGIPGTPSCTAWSFMGRVADDPALHPRLRIANGARGGQSVDRWDHPSEINYALVADHVLAPQGLTEAQVQAVWLKAALGHSTTRSSLPAPDADAYALKATLGDVLRSLRVRYPNLRQVFLSSRIFSYAAAGTTNSPEPYAYETAFGVKWLIDAQITQRAGGPLDSVAGDLSEAVAPWVTWGPYLWAPGDRPRSDGLQWLRAHLQSDGVHPSPSEAHPSACAEVEAPTCGEAIVGYALEEFFKHDPFTRPWFLRSE